ncbi:cytoplasmic dynein 2 intermediate chain 1 isoform X2 [Stegostoma tigrinum]|uniref:cytoplasmic dynein 2 intermediate chain 1 isoform X2 n=1 Tax=Stegostoma tigrinum TaxID=3053191 RepID=UPI0028708879|nr:cytoplasmic dynein 2 intermediate chain 1 isoform X2 [Stegostoma tigrinum]
MKSSKTKTKDDTWKSDELLKHIKAVQGDYTDDNSKKTREKKRLKDDESTGIFDSRERRHRGREHDKEREQDKDRLRNKDKERDGDQYKEREYEKVRKKVKNDEKYKEREKKQEKERDRHKDRDRDKEKIPVWDQDLEYGADTRGHDKEKQWDLYTERSTKQEHESERHRDKERDRRKEREKLQEKEIQKDEIVDQRPKYRQKRDKENLEFEMDDIYERKERKHRERKEKEERNIENFEDSKEKKRRSSEFRDEDYDRRYKEHKEYGPHDGHREKRHKERKEPAEKPAVEEMARKHRVRKEKEYKEDGRKQRNKDMKNSSLEFRDREREHKDRDKRDWERKEDRERKHKHKVKKEKEEKERQEDCKGDYNEESNGKRKKERKSVQETINDGRRKGSTAEQIDSQKKANETLAEELLSVFSTMFLTKSQGTGRFPSTWRSSQAGLIDDDATFIEGEEIAMESQSTIESSNYGDDFEDYEDDFEEEECEDEEVQHERGEIAAYQRAEIEAVQKAITAENEQVREKCTKSLRNTCEEELNRDFENSPTMGPVRGTFIDFGAAKQREISSNVASKQKKRSAELLRLIDMDFSVSFSMLDLPPLNEYDVYIKNFGRTNTKQAFVQCNEDNVDRDVQTDEIETVEKWTQHPGEGNLLCGGANINDALSLDSMAKSIDSRRLTNFLKSACQVISVLLEEDQADNQASQNVQSKATSLSVSDGCTQLNVNLPFLHGREVLCLHFSQVQRQTLLSVHSLPKEPGVVQLASNYVICVWNIWEPSAPQKILVCESEVQCCCFGPNNVVSVFAGTVDGSVVAWDLREHSTIHYTLQTGGQEWTLRTPTFSTDGVLTAINHSCAVKAVHPVSSVCFDNHDVGLSLFSSQKGSSGLSFQLATLDEGGLLNLWVVVELQKADLAGSLTDLGLIPGGKIKLIHSSSIEVNSFFPRNFMQLGPPRTLSIRFLPSDPNHFFIGTDTGLVSHGTRHGLQAAPRLYKSQTNGARAVQVTCIDFCHFGNTLFLIGCSDGTIRLHSVTTENPVIQWNESTQGRSIQAVLWALTRPGMFFVLDASSHVYVWDLLQNVSKPVAEESLLSDKITAIAILGDPEKPSASSGLMLAKQSGAIEIQYLMKQWSEPHLNELETLHYILQKTA